VALGPKEERFMIERWKRFYHNAYEISNFGRVRRAMRGKGTQVGRILKPQINGEGKYLAYQFFFRGKFKTFFIHSIVAKLFIGKKPRRYEVDHVDGNRHNNCADNLEYVTHLENLRRAVRRRIENGIGTKQRSVKLTPAAVRKIRKLINCGWQIKKVAARFAVYDSTILKIKFGKTWKHVS
jgi:hypothetical protein